MSSFLIVSILFYDDKVCRKLRDQQCRRDSILWANRKTLLFILFNLHIFHKAIAVAFFVGISGISKTWAVIESLAFIFALHCFKNSDILIS